MNATGLSWLLIVEVVLPFLILNVVLILVIMAGRKKYKQAAKKLILSVKSSEDSEREGIIRFQTEKLSVKPKRAKRNAKNIINDRKFIIRNLVSGLVDKNVEAISNINFDITRLTNRYHELFSLVDTNANADATEEQTAGAEQDEAAAAAVELKKEIKNLKREVHITLTTLNNIFKEFSSMFGDDDIPDEQMSVDQIITAMAAFVEGSQQSQGDETAALNSSTPPESAASENSNVEAAEQVTEEISVEAKTEVVKGAVKEAEPTNERIEQNTPVAESEPPSKAEAEVVPKSDSDSDIKTAAADDDEEELDFSVDAAIDDIDSALDELELDSIEDEPDWGDAFEESGDKMEGDPK